MDVLLKNSFFNVFLDNYTTESLLKEALVSKSLVYKWVR